MVICCKIGSMERGNIIYAQYLENMEGEKPKQAVYFDLDDTLISKDLAMVGWVKFFAANYNHDENEIKTGIDEYFNKKNDFRPDTLSFFLSQKFFCEPITEENLEQGKSEVYSQSLFEDSVKILEKLKQDGYSLGIWSKGFCDVQMNKITYSGIKKYFDEEKILISDDKLDEKILNQISVGSMIVEDKKTVSQSLADKKRFAVVRIDRKNSGEKIEGADTISCFFELTDLIKARSSTNVVEGKDN